MDVEKILEALTLDEKLSLMHGQLCDSYGGNQADHVYGIPRLGIPDVLWETTSLPAKVVSAATFDTEAALRYGEVLGAEAQSTGMYIILSTRVNIARDPVAQIGQSNGGNFQTLGEDPLLNGLIGRAEVQGIQRNHQSTGMVTSMMSARRKAAGCRMSVRKAIATRRWLL